ncbi:hypothetical protein Pint_32264 [Pistacia integerrima]|uniref:Uncharacterized protein n=1 Tax=Pistacia integerrima TaxID=434235 RepID=A0ACC0XT32_9ROSI|nr:hypothetical protein Pint_32264 [Pistacia integerrima]
MGCFRCSGKSIKDDNININDNNKNSRQGDQRQTTSDTSRVASHDTVKKEEVSKDDQLSRDVKNLNLEDDTNGGKRAETFTFEELAVATGNFRSDCFLGEGGFGKVYKGHLDRINQVVAIKQLDRNGAQGIREFVVEVLTLSLADHPNLVKLIGFCAEGDQRLLVYEYMPLGSLENHLFDIRSDRKPLDWNTRMKIAAGAARGLEYLHEKMKPPVIYRDLKCSNILLVICTSTMLVRSHPARQCSCHSWQHSQMYFLSAARPMFKDRRNFSKMVDPLLEGQYPVRGLYQALAIAAMCVQEQPNMRPAISDVVMALGYLASQIYDPLNPSARSARRKPPCLVEEIGETADPKNGGSESPSSN